VDTESVLPGVKWPEFCVDDPPNLESTLKKEYSYIYIPLWAFMVCCRVNFTFTFTTWRGEVNSKSKQNKHLCQPNRLRKPPKKPSGRLEKTKHSLLPAGDKAPDHVTLSQ
jgi:hypothetical protein